MDSILKKLIDKHIERSEQGLKKYGTDLDRKDLLFKDWLVHIQEELMDGALYVTKILSYIDELENYPKNEADRNQSK